MFDNLTVTKNYKVVDSITNNNIDVCSFNASLNAQSGIHVNLNISYPNLYNANKDAILTAYRSFCGEVTSLAISMGLALAIEDDNTIIGQLDTMKEEIKTMATSTFKDIIASLGDITVNPVPVVDVGIRNTYQNNSYVG